MQAPRVCPFQTAEYTILIQQVDANETVEIGPIQYSYQSPFIIEILVNSSLELDSEYLITATFSSLVASTVSLTNATVCKFTSNLCQCIVNQCIVHPKPIRSPTLSHYYRAHMKCPSPFFNW